MRETFVGSAPDGGAEEEAALSQPEGCLPDAAPAHSDHGQERRATSDVIPVRSFSRSPPVRVRSADPSDLPEVFQLLTRAALPVAGVAEAFDAFVVAEPVDAPHRVLGAAGLELHGRHALLRSVVVASTVRGAGIGVALVGASLEEARRRGCADIWLLTTTAGAWFCRLGFVEVSRSDVPTPLLASVEFRGACPASAAILRRTVGLP